MSEPQKPYTPSVEDLARAAYCTYLEGTSRTREESAAEFDQMLSRVRAEALREAADALNAEFQDIPAWAEAYREGVRTDEWMRGGVRAGVVAEEPEWEIEVSYSSASAPSIDGYRLRRAMRVESIEKAQEFATRVERPIISKRTKAVPAGEWVRVPLEQGEGS